MPKVELVGALRVLYETDRFPMARKVGLMEKLLTELREFKMRPPRIDPADPESWREGQFDDLVFAVALAAWRASRHVPAPQFVRDRWNEKLKNYYKQLDKGVA